MENDNNLIEFTSPSNSPFTNNNHNQMPIITSSNPFDEPPINFDCPTQFVSPSKINFEDFNCDFLRESTIGRESLLLQFQSENYGRESLGILDLDDIDIGRESLGIERLKITKKSINKSNKLNNNDGNNDVLNQALLYSTEDLNDTVFNSTNPSSFNSNSLRSSLFSISSIKVTDLTSNILNKRFNSSNELYDRLKFPKLNHLNRISSLPESLPINEHDEHLITDKLWNSAIATVNPPTSKNSEELDPILMEARHFADHIENGLIFNDELDDIYTLEHTTQPNLVENSFDNSQDSPPQKSSEITNESNQQDSNSITKDPRELLNSLSEILCTNNQQTTKGHLLLNSLANILLSKSNSPPPSSSSSVDDDHNHRDDSGNSSIENVQQPEQDLQLVNNECYEVLDLRLKTSQDHSKSSGSDDLPLDLSIKSLKEHEFVQPKIVLTKSDHNQKNSTLNCNRSHLLSSSSSSSISQNDNTSLNNTTPKYSFNNSSLLKIKKIDDKKRMGPLKAVIPIDNMMKTPVSYNPTTPTTDSKLKKTSTPINDPKMRPMAQSTPDTTASNAKWKLSPLQPTTTTSDQNPTTSTESKCRLNYSDSNLSSDQSKSLNKTNDNRKLRYSLNEEQQRPKSFLQRRSLSDLKRPQLTKTEQQQQHQSIPRSYSAGKDPKILSSVKRVRQSINNNKNEKTKGIYRSYSTEKEANLEKTKTKILNENKNRTVGNIGNRSSMMVKKTIGKENR